jgi:hypothetical protein
MLLAIISVWLKPILNETVFKNNLVFKAVFNCILSCVSHRFAEPCVVMAGVPGDNKTVLCVLPHPTPSVLLFCRQKSCHSNL